MFGEYRTLSAKPGYSYTYTDGWTLSANPVYSYTYTDGWVYHGHSRYSCESVIRIILAETSLRSTVQREDALNNKIRAVKKLADIDSNPSQLKQLKQLEKELEKLKKTRSHQVRTLYEWECMLRVGSLRRGYISVKSNPVWYFRKELVEDCISRGGCCSRDCGCCERRRLSAKKGTGIGHCTVECMCCIHDRGSEFTAEEKKDFNDRFGKMLRSNNPAFLLRIANAYFSKPLFWKIKTKHK